MAIDLEAIRKRVAELSGVRKSSSIQQWKPKLGEHKIRCLPWNNCPDGQPFLERWFYYLGNNPGIVSPTQFGKPDPINDLIKKLYSSGKSEDKALAKQLHPKMRCYAPIIVRGQEDMGVIVWAFGKIVYQRMLGFFLDEEVGDILSATDGFDLKVTVSQSPGKQYLDTMVDPARRSSKLHDDPATSQKWIDSLPNIDDMYRQKTPQEIEGVLNNWLSGGTPEEVNGGGVVRGPANHDELDKLAQEIKTTDKKAVVVEKQAQKKVEATVPVKKQSLDDAFKDLMEDE